MSYLEKIKDCDDFRVPNKEAFKMEQVQKFNLGNYIDYYIDQDPDDSDEETKADEFSDSASEDTHAL
jgi:hypothetical protein